MSERSELARLIMRYRTAKIAVEKLQRDIQITGRIPTPEEEGYFTAEEEALFNAFLEIMFFRCVSPGVRGIHDRLRLTFLKDDFSVASTVAPYEALIAEGSS